MKRSLVSGSSFRKRTASAEESMINVKRQMIKYTAARAAAAIIGLELSLPENGSAAPPIRWVRTECLQCETRCTVLIGFTAKTGARAQYCLINPDGGLPCLRGLDALLKLPQGGPSSMSVARLEGDRK